MSPQDTRHLQDLLKSFDAERLGEGDAVAGANLLAAMACSLANIQRPGSGLVTKDGQGIAVGTSMLVSGAYTSNLVTEKVLAGLAARQDNLVEHLRQRNHNPVEKPKGISLVKVRPGGFGGDWAGSIIRQLDQPGVIGDGDVAALWGMLLATPARVDLDDLHDCPMVYLTGTSAAKIAGQLDRCHLGRPFIHVGLDEGADFSQFQHQCPAVIDGRLSVTRAIRGTVVVTDPNGLLGEAVQDDMPSSRWTSRLLWLVDGKAGPEPGDAAEGNEAAVAPCGLYRRYETAMGLAWGNRISGRETGTVMLDCEFTEAQVRWMTFLREVEPEFPGIVGTARNLYATLLFGLRLTVDPAHGSSGFAFQTDQVQAFAKFIVSRMVNARAAALEVAETDRKEQLEASIIHKLGDGPHCIRDLSRRFDRLPSGTCHGLLLDLQAAGRVSFRKGKWRLSPSAVPTDPGAGLVLEA